MIVQNVREKTHTFKVLENFISKMTQMSFWISLPTQCSYLWIWCDLYESEPSTIFTLFFYSNDYMHEETPIVLVVMVWNFTPLVFIVVVFVWF